MKETKKDTFIWESLGFPIRIWEGLGFPIRLINVPMKKVIGKWAMDINFGMLQVAVINMLARKQASLTGGELRFIMGYLKMPTRSFAKLFDVTHVAVLKWLNEDVKMNPNTEICLRLYILDYLQVTDREFKKLYLKIRQKNLEANENPLEIDAEKIAC